MILSMFFRRYYCLSVGPSFSSSLGSVLGSSWRGLFVVAEAFDMFLCFEYVGTFGVCCFDNRVMFLRSQNFQLPPELWS